jgi:hypothetical protein
MKTNLYISSAGIAALPDGPTKTYLESNTDIDLKTLFFMRLQEAFGAGPSGPVVATPTKAFESTDPKALFLMWRGQAQTMLT